MAEVGFPHVIVYEIERPASGADVVAALLGAEQLLRETVPLLEGCIDGLPPPIKSRSTKHTMTKLASTVAMHWQRYLSQAIPMA